MSEKLTFSVEVDIDSPKPGEDIDVYVAELVTDISQGLKEQFLEFLVAVSDAKQRGEISFTSESGARTAISYKDGIVTQRSIDH